jgi:hypothetical protein
MRIAGFGQLLDDRGEDERRMKTLVVPLDQIENGSASHDGCIEQPIEALVILDTDLEGTGVFKLLGGPQQPGVHIRNYVLGAGSSILMLPG